MSFDAGAGEIPALLGPNGAGNKTTALRCIAGVLRPGAGEVAILGRPSTSATARGALSFLPEQPDLYPALTVAEHLRFIALAHRLTDAWQTRAGELAERWVDPTGVLAMHRLTRHPERIGDVLPAQARPERLFDLPQL